MPSSQSTPWPVFVWAAAIVTSIIGFIFWRTEALRDGLSEVQNRVGVIQTDVIWIKRALEKQVVAK